MQVAAHNVGVGATCLLWLLVACATPCPEVGGAKWPSKSAAAESFVDAYWEKARDVQQSYDFTKAIDQAKEWADRREGEDEKQADSPDLAADVLKPLCSVDGLPEVLALVGGNESGARALLEYYSDRLDRVEQKLSDVVSDTCLVEQDADEAMKRLREAKHDLAEAIKKHAFLLLLLEMHALVPTVPKLEAACSPKAPPSGEWDNE